MLKISSLKFNNNYFIDHKKLKNIFIINPLINYHNKQLIMEGKTLEDKIWTIKTLWEKAILEKHIIPIIGVNFVDGIEILSKELCGPNDIRLCKDLYPMFYEETKDLLKIFREYFAPSSNLNQTLLLNAGIFPTCAYVGEYALWHRKDLNNNTSIFPQRRDHVLPQINPQTNFFEAFSSCNRRISRACNEIATFDGWLSYFAATDDTSSSIDSYSFLGTLKNLSEGILSEEEKMSQYVKCYELVLLENKGNIYRKYRIKGDDTIITFLNGPKFDYTIGTQLLENLNHGIKRLAVVSKLFFNPLTDEQQQIVNETLAEPTMLIKEVELALLSILKQKITEETGFSFV